MNRRWLIGLSALVFVPKRVMAHYVGVDKTSWEKIEHPEGTGKTFNMDVCQEWRHTYHHNGNKITECVLIRTEPL